MSIKVAGRGSEWLIVAADAAETAMAATIDRPTSFGRKTETIISLELAMGRRGDEEAGQSAGIWVAAIKLVVMTSRLADSMPLKKGGRLAAF